ncbi:glycogen synthase GlgA [candidate division GN15 bacterium]|nr:glycogen synthase GlgA [candidate division GN15 bacterium]
MLTRCRPRESGNQFSDRMKRLKILMAASEVAGYARTGGLGDVLAALPRELAKMGHEVKVFMPWYGQIDDDRRGIRADDRRLAVSFDSTMHQLTLGRRNEPRLKLETLLLGNDDLFGRSSLYVDPETGHEFGDNDERFAVFCKGVLEACRALEWRPDVVHVHDWQTALIPVYLKTVFADDPLWRGVPSVLTIHNLGYQGSFDAARFGLLGLPAELMHPVTGALEFYGRLNLLKGAIVLADKLTTVSERYAQEIQSTSEFGHGLEGVLQQRSADLTGILNGVDYTVWSPSRDKEIPYRYHPANLSGKRMTKVELLNRAGLPHREKDPLIGMVTRLADQKGLDLVAAAADRMLSMDLQLIVLGTGEPRYHELLQDLERRYPDKCKAYLTFDNELSHQIEAASDIFLMPSRYEPCGLNQMYSLKYGTVPVVRDVGGLADTVIDYDAATGQGTGFLFGPYTAEAMLEAITRAVELYPRRRTWTKLMKAGMKQDFSWQRSAEKYAALFESLPIVSESR